MQSDRPTGLRKSSPKPGPDLAHLYMKEKHNPKASGKTPIKCKCKCKNTIRKQRARKSKFEIV